jgi:hypothetical protein
MIRKKSTRDPPGNDLKLAHVCKARNRKIQYPRTANEIPALTPLQRNIVRDKVDPFHNLETRMPRLDEMKTSLTLCVPQAQISTPFRDRPRRRELTLLADGGLDVGDGSVEGGSGETERKESGHRQCERWEGEEGTCDERRTSR